MNALDYPISLGFGEYGAAGYTQSRPHKGNDYSAGRFVPVLVVGVQIGLTGSTGNVTGPHVHVQAGRDEWAQNPINPTPYVGKAGIVVKTGRADQWGNYVCIRVGDVNVFYCHLDSINVKVGQVIKERKMIENSDQWFSLIAQLDYNLTGHRLNRDEFVKYYVGNDAWEMVQSINARPETARHADWANWGRMAKEDNWAGQIKAATDAVAELQSKLAAGGSVNQADIDALAKQADDLEQAIKNVNK